MNRPKRGIARIVQLYGDPHQIIPPLVNEMGQVKAAERLGVSPFTVNRWLRMEGYRMQHKIIYTREALPERESVQ